MQCETRLNIFKNVITKEMHRSTKCDQVISSLFWKTSTEEYLLKKKKKSSTRRSYFFSTQHHRAHNTLQYNKYTLQILIPHTKYSHNPVFGLKCPQYYTYNKTEI